MQAIFITGTDTGVGKTVIAAHLLRQLREKGMDAGYWKPVETGVAPGESRDAEVVQSICGEHAPVSCTVSLPEAIAPNVAARRAERPISLDKLDETFERLQKMYTPLVIEGAGGLLVNLTEEIGFAELAEKWGVRVLLVVANRLGCLNHAALTKNELDRRGLELGGWVLNHVSAPDSIAAQTNLEELQRFLGDPLAVVAYGAAQMASLIDI